MNKRPLIVVLAVVLAACLAGAGFFWWISTRKPAATPAQSDTVQVLVAAADIPAGTASKDMSAMVIPSKLPKASAPANAVTDLSRVAGQKTVVAIKAGEALLSSAFGSAPTSGNGGEDSMPRGTVELFMSLSGTSAASGTLKAGQTVSIFVTMEDKGGKQATKQAFSHVPITRIIGGSSATTTSTSSGTDKDGATPSPTPSASSSTPARSGSAASNAAASLTFGFALSPKDAARLITSFRSGQIWLAVENNNSPAGLGPAITPDEVFG